MSASSALSLLPTSMSSDNSSVFTVRELGCKAEEGTQIFTDVELTLNEGMAYDLLKKCSFSSF